MGELALVTGASSGIGRAFAERLAQAGHDLIVVGRRTDRLRGLADANPQVSVRVVTADLASNDGIDAVAGLCESEAVGILINNAGVAHYKPLAELPADEARELLQVKVAAPTLLSRAALAGMLRRGRGTIINIGGMLAFSGPAPAAPPASQRAIYTGALAGTVAMTQTLHAELEDTGVSAHVVCPGIVATEFHEIQGMDLSAAPRMSPSDVVTAALGGIARGEVVIAPGVDDERLLADVFAAELAAFQGQTHRLAARYHPDRSEQERTEAES